MREVQASEITRAVKDLFIDANCNLGEDVLAAFDQAIEKDESPVAKEVLKELKENARIARDEQSPICQDTGLAVLFVEIGQDVHVVGGDLKAAINEGVKKGYGEGYLRKSACHPFTRANTKDNTPAVIHFDIVPGDKVRIVAVPKGGGAENMSRVDMLSPSAGLEGIKDFVVKRLEASGSNPCPPTVVGVGIGGTFERSALLAKKALVRSASATPTRSWQGSRSRFSRGSTNWVSGPWATEGTRRRSMYSSKSSPAISQASPWRSTSSATRQGIRKQ
jgi:fumarate hydratase subunit alpha